MTVSLGRIYALTRLYSLQSLNSGTQSSLLKLQGRYCLVLLREFGMQLGEVFLHLRGHALLSFNLIAFVLEKLSRLLCLCI